MQGIPSRVVQDLEEPSWLRTRSVIYFYVLSFGWTIGVGILFLIHSFVFHQSEASLFCPSIEVIKEETKYTAFE
jgi:hypothetical protein